MKEKNSAASEMVRQKGKDGLSTGHDEKPGIPAHELKVSRYRHLYTFGQS